MTYLDRPPTAGALAILGYTAYFCVPAAVPAYRRQLRLRNELGPYSALAMR